MTSDLDLLGQYARENSQEAFGELVRRHLDLVYSAAFRQVRSPQLAEEVAQSVFTDLARNASTLRPDTILTAWLYQVTHHTAIDVVRRESRRHLREQIAVEMNAMNATIADWTPIEPLLDEAMQALDDTDRTAVLLRYFENKSLREVGQTLGTTEDAAQKRVSRAIERLREFFTRRGVTVGASGLVVVLSANAVQAAPAGLMATISTAVVLAGTTITTTATATAIKIIAMTALQKSLVTATVAVLAGVGIYEVRQAVQLREQNQTLQQQQASLAEQLQQLQRERDDATNQLALMADEIVKNQTASQTNGPIHRSPLVAPEPPPQEKTLNDWVSDLESTNNDVIQAARKALADLGPEAAPAIPRLAQMLGSGHTCNSAAWALVKIGTNSLPVLLDALTNGNTFARLEVAGAIGWFREAGAEAVPGLVECMKDDDPGVRMNAIGTLQAIPKMPDIAVPALIACLSDPDASVRQSTTTVLEKYGKVEADTTIPLLVQAARQDPNPRIRDRAAEILRTVAPQRAEAEGL
jgi:RNA polymerase sigma factor (sigma-70 family)